MSNFTNSPLINLTNLSPHRNSPRNQPIRRITIHHFAGNATIESVSNFLRQPGRNASYNYGIGSDGRIVLIVNERDRCWGTSSAANDHQAVVIGVANNTGAPGWGISDRAMESLIALCACICRRNPGIVQANGQSGLRYTGAQNASLNRHNLFAATACPGPFLQSRFPQIAAHVNARLGSAAPTPQPTPPPAPAGQSFRVRVTAPTLNIRRGPGTNHPTNGRITDRGVYTIVGVDNGPGARSWGRLKSGAGWIALDFTVRV